MSRVPNFTLSSFLAASNPNPDGQTLQPVTGTYEETAALANFDQDMLALSGSPAAAPGTKHPTDSQECPPARTTGQCSQAASYVVKAGDTMWAIAKAHGTSIGELQQANPGLFTPGIDAKGHLRASTGWWIYPGDQIALPGTCAPAATQQPGTDASDVHVVKPGDTLWAIARDHGLTVDDLRSANPELFQEGTDAQGRPRSADGWWIYPGDRVILPLPARPTPAPCPVQPGTTGTSTGTTGSSTGTTGSSSGTTGSSTGTTGTSTGTTGTSTGTTGTSTGTRPGGHIPVDPPIHPHPPVRPPIPYPPGHTPGGRGIFYDHDDLLPFLLAGQRLKLGDRNPAVYTLQRALVTLGYPLADGFTGDYNWETVRAVAAFQRDNRLPVTGEVDATTMMAIDAAAPSPFGG